MSASAIETDFAIVGAGPCGLGAAWQLENLRRSECASSDYVLIDDNATPGGSASSFTTAEGFTFDFGGHVLYPHEHYSGFKELLDGLVPEWHESVPVRGVWIDGRLVPYPVQRNIHRLPFHKMVRSLVGLCAVALQTHCDSPSRPPSAVDLETHLTERFGGALTALVMAPLNRKMWAHDLRELASDWTGQRSGSNVANVADTDLVTIARSILTGRDNPGWNANTRVRYPSNGGTGAIWKNLARRLPTEKLLSNERVVGVDVLENVLRLASGKRVRYRRLLSTMPLDTLLTSLRGAPRLRRLAPKMRYAQAYFAGFGLRGDVPQRLRGVHSFHVVDPALACWRITLPGNFAPGNVPAGDHWSMLCEVSDADTAGFDFGVVAERLERALRERALLPAGAVVVSRWQARMKHGYPVPFLGRDDVLSEIHAALRALRICSRGRFGGWKYEVSNQDHAFMQGVEAVDHLVREREETTYRSPRAINALAS